MLAMRMVIQKERDAQTETVKTMNKANNPCPECHKPMIWKPYYGYICEPKCEQAKDGKYGPDENGKCTCGRMPGRDCGGLVGPKELKP